MAHRTLRGRRRAGSRTAAIATMGAGGILAGSALAWLFSPGHGAERRERARRALSGAAERTRVEARAVSARTSEALHGLQGRLEAEAKAAPARARDAAEALRSRAERERAALEARGWSPRRTAMGVAGGALIGRAVLGKGLLRIPFGLLGASILARAASESPGFREGLRRTGEAARQTGEKLRPEREARKPGAGAGPRPEVREVKSPGELEQGIATGRPDPTYAGRADRSGPHMGGGAAGRSRRADEAREDEGILSAPTTDDVRREGGLDAPAPGASVREGDLGVTLPHEGAAGFEEDDEAPRILGPDGAPAGRGREARPAGSPRREPGEDDGR